MINTYIFDTTMSISYIQDIINNAYKIERYNQFGEERFTFLFKPGEYSLSIPMGFYTSIYGLGKSPEDVIITGEAVYSEPYLDNNNSTCNFWRSIENITIKPDSGKMLWAVSQACPFRRVKVIGDLVLHKENGWASGGFIADSIITGQVDSGSQQQWYTRNSQWNNWTGYNWNMFFQGVINSPDGSWPEIPYTSIDSVPVVKEKPYIYMDKMENYFVYIPPLKKKTKGVSWNDSDYGESIPLSDFYIADFKKDSAETINMALALGKNLIFTPGIYNLLETIYINNPSTIVLGLGYATLNGCNGQNIMEVADADGIIISGILFEAGEKNSNKMLEVGKEGCSHLHIDNPIVLHDLVFRIGGLNIGNATIALEINSNNVIGDHFWIWRADHGINKSVGWEINKSDYGIIINGDDVTIYGLFVEHFQKYNTLWNGERGQMYFYQCEFAYDVPDNGWKDGEINGYSAYKVSENVKNHLAMGLGMYSVFNNPNIEVHSAISSPVGEGIIFKNMLTVHLRNGKIKHIFNELGNSVDNNNKKSILSQYSPG
ncbi:MAG: coagulation factor 5/8 type domain-containing protein [Spirochaetales bacterium]|nr:coagulation factor 5/8 type domain-containing protein [Spirochaetales bacterium]